MNKEIKVVFFGTPDFAMPVLQALVENGYDVSRFKSKVLKDMEVFEEFKALEPDLCVVAAYGKILPKRFLEVPKYGFINIHPSLLPKYRGASPIQTALINGDEISGVSLMLVDEEVDHGPVLTQKEYLFPKDKYYNEIASEMFSLGADMLVETLPAYIAGEIKPVEQDHDKATFTKMFKREDGRINWAESAEKTYDRIRALNPEPGTWTMWKEKVLNIKKASLREGNLFIERIQMEGKKEMAFEDFLRGQRDFDISQLV